MSATHTAVVTGANTGLGFETTVGLANAGFHVVMACRDLDKAAAAAKRVKERVANASVECAFVDMIDRESIRAFALDLADRHESLDVLINNAGVFCPPYTITANGVELQFDANHLGPFLLTGLLLPLLQRSTGGRVVNVSSVAASSPRADIYFDNLNFEGNYSDGPLFWGRPGMTAYCQSKLANLLFTLGLARRLSAADLSIKAVAAHPGVSNTEIARHMPKPLQLALNLSAPVLPISTPKAGARPMVFAAVEGDVGAKDFIGPVGWKEYAGRPGRVRLPEKALDTGRQDRLWRESERLVGHAYEF